MKTELHRRPRISLRSTCWAPDFHPLSPALHRAAVFKSRIWGMSARYFFTDDLPAMMHGVTLDGTRMLRILQVCR